MGAALPPAGVLRAGGHGGMIQGGRRARTWIIQHCPRINRLVLGGHQSPVTGEKLEAGTE